MMLIFSCLIGATLGFCLVSQWWRSCFKRLSVLFRHSICRAAQFSSSEVMLPCESLQFDSLKSNNSWLYRTASFIDLWGIFIKERLIEDSPAEVQGSVGYIFCVQGKLMRSRIFHLVCEACNGITSPALAAAIELEHTASLLHDDVVDNAHTRRGRASHCEVFGNLRSILHGDYLVAVLVEILADLDICDVTKLFGSSMEDLVRGELIQINTLDFTDLNQDEIVQHLLKIYLEKCYCKTAALFVVCVAAAGTVSGHGNKPAMRELGLCVGMCFQIVDDILDFGNDPASLKPSDGFDLASGHATAPVIFAVEEFPDALIPRIERRFKNPTDRMVALNLVRRSKGIEASVKLAERYASRAKQIIKHEFRESDYRTALESIVDVILNRST